MVPIPQTRAAARRGLQRAARPTGQTARAVVMRLLFSMSSPDAPHRIGLALGAFLTLAAGFVSTLRAGIVSK